MDSTQTASLQQEAQRSGIMSQSQTTSTSPQSASPSSRPSSHKPHSLSLDLSDLPPLITPSPPSNTLLITNLLDASIFHPASLATIRENVSRTATLHSFSPLKSFRRIVASFYSVDDALAIRQQLDGEEILGARVRVFFGAPTPVDPLDERRRHLAAPQSDKLFFISPPPSPPHGWEMRNEEPPNKDVHADDLAQALAKLHSKTANYQQQQQQQQQQPQQFRHQDEVAPALVSPISPARTDSDGTNAPTTAGNSHRRLRSSSTTIVYHPEHHGDSPNLPAVMVEDTTNEDGEDYMDEDDGDDGEKKIMAHTARPPVELMDQS